MAGKEKKKTMELYYVSRNIDKILSTSLGCPGSQQMNAPEFTKHWGLKIEIYADGKHCAGREKVVEAHDVDRKLKCRMRDFEEEDWDSKTTSKIERDQEEGHLTYDEEAIHTFI